MRKLAVCALLGITLIVSTATADTKEGQKIFLEKFKTPCGMSGAKYARIHTQDEWEAIQEAGQFEAEAKKICPKLKKVKAKYILDVYDFVYEYAKDSGNIPSY